MKQADVYRAMWRWHFYAGLIVLPVLALMAVTGALYLYKSEIEALLYPVHVMSTEDRPTLAPAHIISITEQSAKARVIQLLHPSAPDESWRVTTDTRNGREIVYFVDAKSGLILGHMTDGGVMQTVRDLHSLALTGPVGNRLVEVVAGWAILLCVTGLYLRWPRRGQPALAIRGRAGGRLFWRDVHGTLGFLSAGVILFLAITGMPWTNVWGGGLRAVVAARGVGRPPMKVNPWATPVKQALPWTLREQGAPAGGPGDIGVDAVARIAARHGFASGYQLFLPASPGAPYLVTAVTTRADAARAIAIDAGTGAVLQDMDWRQFGIGAKSVEWGVATHQGQQYGEANRLLMLAGCLCLLALCLTAPILWWKRRFASPPPAPPGVQRMIAGLMLALGLLFPLTGLSMVAALAGEWLVGRLKRA
ncbi:PepSY domain-containing protein [Sphingobium sp.]|uniref:PepSY-associated TM helix domain-containing protein n=1 Tax=Sphingobium sp. TaxID=1912891 RepID=UPI002C1779C6|nr:PepSY domain-containing protein [Sphingobium sp.]HUD93084.1 PepSY domain-containing protein [Sphingobium sp.]